MTFILAHLVKLAYLVALVLAVRRGLHRKCWTWTVYAVSILTLGGLMTLWPSRWYGWEMYTFSRNVYAALKLLIGAEVALHVFAAFPRALDVARGGIALLLVSSIPMIACVPYRVGPWPFHPSVYPDWHLRLSSAAVILFTVTALLVHWFRLPVDRWHRTILLGFTVHLAVFSVLLTLLYSHGFGIAQMLDRCKVLADLGLGCWWIWGTEETR